MNKTDIIASKIYTLESVKKKAVEWKTAKKKIVFTNGCFDILHLGHIDYLAKAADLGDVLIIGVNSDQSVRAIKGDKRPITDEVSRKNILAALFFVDAIILFDEETPYNLIKSINPDVLVKGGDYKVEEIVGYDIVKANNGEIIILDFLPGYSTTNIENKIIQLSK